MSRKKNRRKPNNEILLSPENENVTLADSSLNDITEANDDILADDNLEAANDSDVLTGESAMADSEIKASEVADNADAELSESENTESYAGDTTEEALEDTFEEPAGDSNEENIGESIKDSDEENAEDSGDDSIEIYDIEDNNSHELKKYDQNGFAKFSGDIITGIGSFLRKNLYVVIAAVAVVVVILVAIIFINRNKNNDIQTAGTSANSVSDTAAVSESSDTVAQIPEEALMTDAYEAVNSIVSQYFTAMQNNDTDTLAAIGDGYIDSVEKAKIQVKAQYVEAYQNITCYTKPGPYENSYIVYVKYDVKLKDWDTVAPSLLTLVVCSRDDGSLYVYTGEFDENIANYIRTISSQDDVVDLITKVDAEYKEVLDGNIELAEYMSALNQTIKNEIGELLASAMATENTDEGGNTETGDAGEDNSDEGDSVGEDGQEDTPEEPVVTSFEVKATTTVNVRMSDSEDADKLGKVQSGTVLTCYEERPNGWSQVEYEGKTAYIKTEYLEKVGGEGTPADESQAAGKMKAKDNVKIRKNPSTDADVIAIVSEGEEISYIENMDNGWTKVIYDGQEAYIKTEFLE